LIEWGFDENNRFKQTTFIKRAEQKSVVLLSFDPSGKKGRNLEHRETSLPSDAFISSPAKNHRKHAVENLFHCPQRAACQSISSLERLRARVSRFYMIIANTAGSL